MKQEIEQNIELATLFMMLKDHGTTHIKVSFSGGGDSGMCDEATALPKGYVDEDNMLTFDESPSGTVECAGMPDLAPHLNAIADLVLPHIHDYDWWNNEGGSGIIIFNVTDFTYRADYSICGEDNADYKVDDDGDVDWDSAESDHEYDDYETTGTITIK